jgi:signal transduction histidine kinase
MKLRVLRSMRGLKEPESRRIPLDRVVSEVAHDAGELAKEDGLVVSVQCARPMEANADPMYVRAILENLLDNSFQSLRAAGDHGSVRIRLESDRDRALVRVSDDGPPLDDAVRGSLFEPLRSTNTNGLGLGLPLARALARAMRGDVSFDDTYEKAFCLELPLVKP